jgi:hypothetical protein
MHPARLGCASMAEWGFGGLWSSGVVQAGHVFHHPNKQSDEARQTVHLNQSINVHMRDPGYSPERGYSRSVLHCTWPDHAQGAGAR